MDRRSSIRYGHEGGDNDDDEEEEEEELASTDAWR
jgi:hypothetical protein